MHKSEKHGLDICLWNQGVQAREEIVLLHSYDTFTCAFLFRIHRALPFVKAAGRTAEEEFVVDLHDLIRPECVDIEYVCG